MASEGLIEVPVFCPLCRAASKLLYRRPEKPVDDEPGRFMWQCPRESCGARAELRLFGEVVAVVHGETSPTSS